jgi:hypothetical protein
MIEPTQALLSPKRYLHAYATTITRVTRHRIDTVGNACDILERIELVIDRRLAKRTC